MNQVSFLPYFPSATKKDKVVGRVHFFNFWEYRKLYIKDEAIRAKLERLFAMYVNRDQSLLTDLTVAIIDDNYLLEPLTNEQLKDLERYALALLLCSLVKNQQNGAWGSDHFTLYHQNFEVMNDAISYESGSYIRLKQFYSTTANTRFVKPDFVTSSIFYRYDERLFEALAGAIDARRPQDDFLFAAIQWVKYAFMNADGYSMESRVVMMATAYEILLDLPEGEKVMEFANRLETILGVDQMDVRENAGKVTRGLAKIVKADKRGKSKENTVYGWWARDFYWLRSEIVHRGAVEALDFRNHNGIEHLQLAMKIMHFCFYRLLETSGFIQYKVCKIDAEEFNVERYFTERKLREVEGMLS